MHIRLFACINFDARWALFCRLSPADEVGCYSAKWNHTINENWTTHQWRIKKKKTQSEKKRKNNAKEIKIKTQRRKKKRRTKCIHQRWLLLLYSQHTTDLCYCTHFYLFSFVSISRLICYLFTDGGFMCLENVSNNTNDRKSERGFCWFGTFLFVYSFMFSY